MIVRSIDKHNRKYVQERIDLGAQIRKNTFEGLRLSIKDAQEVLLSIVDPETKDRISIYTTNKAFAASMAHLFESLWAQGKPLK